MSATVAKTEYKRRPADEIVAEIAYEANNAAVSDEVQKHVDQIAGTLGKDLAELRAHLLLIVAIFVEDQMKAHPELNKDALLRMAANEAQFTHMFVARGLKRRADEEIIPARMALVAFDIAEIIGGVKWEDSIGDQMFPHDGKSLRDLMAEAQAEHDAAGLEVPA